MSSKEDYDELLHAAVDLAAELLGEHTEFAPFAMAMAKEDGEIFLVEPDDEDEEEHLELDDGQIVAGIQLSLRESAAEGRWRAVAVVADVTLEDDDGGPVTAAIHVQLEHVGDDPIACSIPYAIEGEEITFDELMAEEGERVVFADGVKN